MNVPSQNSANDVAMSDMFVTMIRWLMIVLWLMDLSGARKLVTLVGSMDEGSITEVVLVTFVG